MKSIYLTVVTFAFMIFAVESSAQTCPEGRIVESPVFVYDANADEMKITVPVKNVGDNGFVSPFKITVYKNDIGDAKRYTYNYNNTIAAGETVNITFGISNFKAEWTPFNNIKIRINDGGNGYSNQFMCDSAFRDYTRTQLIASDDYMLIFNDSEDNQFRVAINDILPSSYVSLTVNLLSDPVYTGTATISGSTIFYTPATNTSADTLRYRIHCGNAEYADTATIYIKIIDKPENIGDAECFVEPEGFQWSIKEAYRSPTATHHNYAIPLVGDINGDNIPEVVTLNNSSDGNTGIQYLNILWGHNKTTTSIKMAANATQIRENGGSICPYTMFRTTINNVEKTIIVVKSTTSYGYYYLYAYDLNGPADQSSTPLWSVAGGNYAENVSVADFDGDGIPEIYMSNKIYNAHTGVLLVPGTGNSGRGAVMTGNYLYFSIAADINNDGKLELIVGNEVYSVNIPNKSGTTNNGLQLIAKLQDEVKFNNGVVAADGVTVVADINQDGRLDVVYISTNATNGAGNRMLIAWDVETQRLICKSDEISVGKGTGIPFIGNIDDDPILETVFMINDKLIGLKPDLNIKKFVLAYSTVVDDESGVTGMTIFDFNQDGKAEIVYRDISLLRIMEAVPGSPGSFKDIKTFGSASTTACEYPVVADVDNDGASEIIVIGNTGGYVSNGYLWIFKSDGLPWAPARKVWNQYAYNAVNINENLTVPAVQMNPATVFPGPDGQLGTSDDIQPYNNFLQQQTALSKNGTTYWEASDYSIEGIPSTVYHEIGDSLVISFCVSNYGDVQGPAPFHVTVYENERLSGNVVATKSYTNIPAPGQTLCYSIKVENVLGNVSIHSLHLWLNDSGGGTNVNPECDYTNGVVIYDVTGTVAAQNDYASLFVCDAVSIPILANDEYSGTTFSILNTPKYGEAIQSGGGLIYANNGSGTSALPCEQTGNRIDTVHYKIESIVSEAEAYAIIKIYSPPEMILENACSPNPKIALSNGYEGFTYDWEYSPDGASGWTFVSTDSDSMELNIANTTAGFYRLTINYEGGKKYQLKQGVEVSVIRTTQLPGGIVWYDLSSNPVNINWQ